MSRSITDQVAALEDELEKAGDEIHRYTQEIGHLETDLDKKDNEIYRLKVELEALHRFAAFVGEQFPHVTDAWEVRQRMEQAS